MGSRGNASHMDFEWANKSGPVDASSPFVRLAQQPNAQNTPSDPAKKRTFSAFASPSKSSFALRDPSSSNGESQTWLFNGAAPSPSPTKTAEKPLPAIPAHRNPAFHTPRRPFDVSYDSSGPDASSPDNNADSEATPEVGRGAGGMGFKSRWNKSMANLFDSTASNKEKRSSALTRVNGKGEIAKNNYSHAVEKRRKKRQGERRRSFWRRNSSASDTDDDDDQNGRKSPNKRDKSRRSTKGPGILVSLFGFIDTHPNLPHVLSFYAQLLLNTFLVLFLIYIIYSFWSTIRSDVDKKSEEAIADIMAEMAACARELAANGCASDSRPPALEQLCNNWQRCAEQNPRAVGRARVSAHTFAEIFNSFIEPISYKAMVFSLVLAFGTFGTCNFAFGHFRNKALAQQQFVSPAQSAYGPPQTPYMQRHPSGGLLDGQQQAYWSAYQSPMAAPLANGYGYGPIEPPPASSGTGNGAGGSDGMEARTPSPRKRLAYN